MIKRIGMAAVACLAMLVASESELEAHGFGGFHGNRRATAYARGVNVGVRGAAYRPYGYRGYGYGGYGYAVPLGPAPGPGPIGIQTIANAEPRDDKSRVDSQARLDDALQQMQLPSDAGLPAAPKK